MLGQYCSRNVGVLELSKRPFVNDSGVARIFEQTRRDPRLCHVSAENEYIFRDVKKDYNRPRGRATLQG